MSKRTLAVGALALVLGAGVAGVVVQADEFTDEDLKRWEAEYMSVVEKGRSLWTSPEPGHQRRGLRPVPSQRGGHPPGDVPQVPAAARQGGGAAGHDQLVLDEPAGRGPLELDSAEMIAMEAYVHYERRGWRWRRGSISGFCHPGIYSRIAGQLFALAWGSFSRAGCCTCVIMSR